MNLSHYVLLKSFFVTARVVWAKIFTEVDRVFLRRNIFTICTLLLRILYESVATICRQIYLAVMKLQTLHENKNAT